MAEMFSGDLDQLEFETMLIQKGAIAIKRFTLQYIDEVVIGDSTAKIIGLAATGIIGATRLIETAIHSIPEEIEDNKIPEEIEQSNWSYEDMSCIRKSKEALLIKKRAIQIQLLAAEYRHAFTNGEFISHIIELAVTLIIAFCEFIETFSLKLITPEIKENYETQNEADLWEFDNKGDEEQDNIPWDFDNVWEVPQEDLTVQEPPEDYFNWDEAPEDFDWEEPQEDFLWQEPQEDFNWDEAPEDFDWEEPQEDLPSQEPQEDLPSQEPQEDLPSQEPQEDFSSQGTDPLYDFPWQEPQDHFPCYRKKHERGGKWEIDNFGVFWNYPAAPANSPDIDEDLG